MDRLNVEKAILAGHSLAGVELTHFAATHPTKVEKLIYLDALDNRREEIAIVTQSPLRNVEQPFFKSLISEFQDRFPHAKIVVIPDGHHYCFVVQEELVYNEMRTFPID